MKEELIKELVANSKFTNRINLQYQHEIETLKKELVQYKNEVIELKNQLASGANHTHTNNTQTLSNTQRDNTSSKVEVELRKKLELAQQKINELESRQKDTVKILNTTSNTDKKVTDLELALGKIKQQNDMLQKKIKEDNERKLKLEKDFEKEQQKLKEMELRAEQQQKILKKKTEDLANAQRRLRSASSAGTVDENKHWVEQEMERIVQEKREMEVFKEELVKREELVKKKELLLKEKNELQLRKLRSSQMTKESIALIDQKLESLDKQKQISSNNIYKDLEETHSQLVKQRKELDERLSQGVALNSQEERRLIEIEEAIEALEIAIEYENDSILDQQNKLKDSILLKNASDDSEEVRPTLFITY